MLSGRLPAQKHTWIDKCNLFILGVLFIYGLFSFLMSKLRQSRFVELRVVEAIIDQASHQMRCVTLIGLRIMVAIIYQAYHQVRWVTPEAWAGQKTKLGQYRVQLGAYAECYMILSAVMVFMHRIATRWVLHGWDWNFLKPDMKQWFPSLKKPPDPFPTSNRKDRKVRKSHTRFSQANRLLCLSLLTAEGIGRETPEFELTGSFGTQDLRKKLHRYSDTCGFLQSTSITPDSDDMLRLRAVLQDLPASLSSEAESMLFVADTGATATTTYDESDFKPGSIRKFQPGEKPPMQGIAGDIPIVGEGDIEFQVVLDDGEVHTVCTRGYLVPDLKCRLFSPQGFLSDFESGEYLVRRNESVFRFGNGQNMTVPYHRQTRLPIFRAYKNALDSAKALALKGCITEETNQNLTAAAKLLLRLHFKLGHLGFATVQWVARQGWLGTKAERMGRSTIPTPKCASCLLGKQSKAPNPAKTVMAKNPGALSVNQLAPGQLIYSDQYVTRVQGKMLPHHPDSGTEQTYSGGTIFYDAASGYVFVGHQVGFTAHETIATKLNFEREAAGVGISVIDYHTDNGVYKSHEFLKELHQKGQGIKFSGVSAQFQNSMAESMIKTVVQCVCTMMLHAAL